MTEQWGEFIKKANEALRLLSSSRQSERISALKSLKIILQNSLNTQSAANDDTACHKIFEALFRFVSIEKPLFSRSARSISQASSASRLSECASVMRTAVEALLPNFRKKSLHALVDHIIQTLSDPNGELRELLSLDYIKCLRSILEYPPHTEHLSNEVWTEATNFCLSYLGHTATGEPELTIRTNRHSSSERLDSNVGNVMSFGSISNHSVRSARNNTNEPVINEIVICIQLLVSSPNAPIPSSAEKLLNGLSHFLSSSSTTEYSQQGTLKAINSIILQVLFDQSTLVKEIFLDITPVLRRLWTGKLGGLKDEVLITIMLCTDLLQDNNQISLRPLNVELIEGLADVMLSEYIKRPERELLQMDDVIFYQKSTSVADTQFIGPRFGNLKSEQNWTVSWTIARLLSLVDERNDRYYTSPADGIPNKRPRLTSRVDGVFQDAASGIGNIKTCSLQLLVFIPCRMGAEEAKIFTDKLMGIIMDDNDFQASWAFLALTSMANTREYAVKSFRTVWLQAWSLASRASVIQGTSRAACMLMQEILRLELLESSDTAETIRAMLNAAELNGPSLLCDTSLMLWIRVLDTVYQLGSNYAVDASRQICNWIRGLWTIGTLNGKVQVAQVAASARPAAILELLFHCTGKTSTITRMPFRGITGPIANARMSMLQHSELIKYLFSENETGETFNDWNIHSSFLSIQASSLKSDPSDGVILNLLRGKIEDFSHVWKNLSAEKSFHITAEYVQIIASICVITIIFVECLPSQSNPRREELTRSSNSLWQEICLCIANKEDNYIYALLDVLAPVIWSIPCERLLDDPLCRAINKMAPPLIKILRDRQHSLPGNHYTFEPETMELDNQELSQPSRLNRDSAIRLNRRKFSIVSDFATLERALTVQLAICYYQNKNIEGMENRVHESLINYLKSLDTADVLSANWIWNEVFSSFSKFPRQDILDILEHFGEICLQSYEGERCESCQCICIEMMAQFVPCWVNSDEDNLTESASDLYRWFVQVLLEKKKASPHVLSALASLLANVLGVNPLYALPSGGPSARTSLFHILQIGSLSVKFEVAQRIPVIFGRFLLRDHELIFEDVLESLPTESEWSEGIALRLYVLARLASTWHTLLRRSIYHIFETPGQLPQSSPYAKKCLNYIGKALALRDPREIFRLFSSQILYTWTESQSIMSMPFSIFGYHNLREMMLDVQDEIIGQISMRANDLDAASFSDCVGSDFISSLEESFHKAEAYAIARDISIPPSQDSQPKGVESRLRKLLGGDRFLKVVEKKFPQIVSVLFKSLDHEEQIERAFAKRPHFHYASAILHQIVKKGASKATLPPSQQPSFRARYLLDELEFLCKRAGYDLETMWSPALASAVCRALLEAIHPALGSLHACSVLRKLRILVSIAGPIMLQDYPLEQTIHALCPFLTDFNCSDDALGLYWYLLEAGRNYLAKRPTFVAGIAVTTFVSLQKFFISAPDSTTQESEFNVVLTKLHEFKKWFADYLEDYTSPNLSDSMHKSFQSLVRAAQKVSGVGNATKGTYESDLLLEILQDRSSQDSLLDSVVSDIALSRLSANFERPKDLRDDILGDDVTAREKAMPLWQFIQRQNCSRSFYLWAARVNGRAYAACGYISPDLLSKENPQTLQISPTVQNADPSLRSKIKIIKKLREMLYGSNRSHLGLIERTLQLIVSQISTLSDLEQREDVLPSYLMKALIWSPYQCPNIPRLLLKRADNIITLKWKPNLSAFEWARDLALALVHMSDRDPVVGPLGTVLYHIPDLPVQVLPYIIHDILLNEVEGDQNCRRRLSDIFSEVLNSTQDATIPHAQIIIDIILYLRDQEKPHESTVADRDSWLDIDYQQAAVVAASRCNMHKTALLFLEIQASRASTGGRRSSVAQYIPPSHLLHDIFRHIGDPDMFYGVQLEPTLNSVMDRLDYEGEGFKNLIFQSAHYDSNLRTTGQGSAHGMIKALNSTNLQGVARSLCSTSNNGGGSNVSTDYLISTALSLQQWDIPVPISSFSATGVLFTTFQNMNLMGDKVKLLQAIDDSLIKLMDQLTEKTQPLNSLKESMRSLGILSEIDSVLNCTSEDQLEEEWNKIVSRNAWFRTESFSNVSQILLSHETLFSSINQDYLRSSLKLTSKAAQLFEVKAIRESLRLSRNYNDSQTSLRSAMSLAKLVGPCTSLGLKIDAAANFDLANVLWDLGEMATSTRLLQEISQLNDLNRQSLPVSRAEVLATLGHYLAEARLEKPEAIVQGYLYPAVKELRGISDGEESGRVFHRFALFCDQQIQNQEDLEDFRRIEELRNRKEREVLALDKMMETVEGKEKVALKLHRAKAKQWFDLDDREYQRLHRSREALLQQCLENYLLSLKACETYNSDSLRFCALWLDNSGDGKANSAVAKIIERVPSRKFASLMNQLSSRLLDSADQFQTLLFSLILRTCIEHPYHGMYQIFASSKSKGGRDPTALSRYQAAGKLVEKLKNNNVAGPTWVAIHNTNISYVRFAAEKLDEKCKSGARVPLRALPTGQRLEQDATTQKLPPPTMKIELRVDRDYSNVPKVVKFNSEFTIASGVSAPKIVTALATDGLRYKQLIKGGNDDLRQDAIMEQVFEQVSNLLKENRTTQRRSLGIRTYKVLPLTSNAGIIEFVQNTIPLNEFLLPAHQRYYPKDMRPNACRKHISDVQPRSLEQRVRTFRQVIDHFHPVMRYFFMEKFHNPDDWFSKRLAYTRSTAAISILGHVLGLGDRHGHNILLDEKTGEVVHIDLGVAFEQGRVLPVPEVVPFRLTRDLVDGMGITKTEGVFRRCCEFTLEALRQESYSIMTILDVLRYDPLYSWTLSPLRMRRMQEDQQAAEAVSDLASSDRKNTPNEASEADRALTVVVKKLSKTLSVTATVNELIQQATDERNLAVLYCGWAAYA